MKRSVDMIRVRKEELEYGFLRGVKEYVRQKVEMGAMPWGKRVFYPKMVLRARPQKLRDFLIDEELWSLSEWKEETLKRYGEGHHLNKCGGRYYMGIYFKSTKGRDIRRKISLGTKDIEEAKRRRDEFYKEWVGKALKWYMADGAKWNMKLPGVPELGIQSQLEKRAREAIREEQVRKLKEEREKWKAKREEQVRMSPFWDNGEKRSKALTKKKK